MKRFDAPIKAALAALAALLLLAAAPAAVVLGPSLAASGSSTDWPMYLHDASLSAASSETILSSADAPNLRPLWTFKTGGVISASATVVGGVAYIGSWDGYEYALDATTGAQIWKTFLGITTAPTCSPPQLGVSSVAAVVGGVVYVGGGDSNWYALNAATGAVLWSVPTGDNSAAGGHYNWASPLIIGNSAYIGIASLGDCPLVQGQLLRVDLTSHTVVASVNFVPTGQVGGGVWTTPAYDAGTNTIYVTTGTLNQVTQTMSEAMVALDGTTLAVKSLWQIPRSAANADSDWGTSPILFTDSNNRSMVAGVNKNGFLYAFDRTNLALGPIWSEPIAVGGICPTCGDASVASLAFANGLLYVGGGNTTIGGVGYPGAIRAINPTTGAVIWAHGLADPIIPALAYDNGMVFAGSGPRLEVFDAANGARIGSYSTGAVTYSPPTISGGTVFMGNGAGTVFAFTPVTPTTPPADPACPAGFVCSDIGSPSPAGSETVTSGSWAISAGGTGIGGASSDSFRFMAKPVSGDLGLTARVTAQSVAGTGTASGIMVRQASDPGSPFYSLAYTGGNSVSVAWRSIFGGATKTVKVSAGALPARLKIQRVGDAFTASTSADGITYTLVPGSSASVTMTTVVMAGLAASSGVGGTSSSSTIDSLVFAAPGTPASPQAPASACPSGWSCVDVGNPAAVGDQSLTSGTWTIKGAGSPSGHNIYSDQFHFVWQALAGDGTLSERVVSQPNTAGLAQAGLVFRANATDASAPFYGSFITPTGGIQTVYRSTQGLRTILQNTTSGAAPAYLQISRYGNTYTTFTSTNGTTWTGVIGSSVTFGSGGAMVAGLTVDSGSTTTLATDVIDSVSLAHSAAPPPSLCPSGWTCQDIGSPTPQPGSQFVVDPNWTVQAGGSDVWGAFDAFRLVSEPMASDGSVSARVDSQDNSSPWAKAGVMIRASNNPGSPYFAAFITPGNGIAVQWRTSQGANTSQVLASGHTAIWLKVSRAGSTFTAYTSADGTSWTPISGASATFTMNGQLLAGLAVCSHNGGAMGTVTFDTATVTGGPPPFVGTTYHPVTPTRLLDTRDGTGGISGTIGSKSSQTFTVTGTVIPSSATAVTGNLTETGATGAGFLYIGPTANDNPTSSNLNFPVGDARANSVTVGLGGGGTLSFTYVSPKAGARTHVVFDVTGYFTPDDTGATYHQVTPTRLLDSRNGTGGVSGSIASKAPATFTVTGTVVPDTATAVTGNLTVTGATGGGFLFLGPTAIADPGSSTLNFPAGDTRANGVTVEVGAGVHKTLSVTYVSGVVGARAHVIFDVTGYFTADLTGAHYIPVAPARILDTRNGTGGVVGPIGSKSARTFPVIGAGGVAPGAIAVTGNLTVTGQNSTGYLSIGPVADNNPGTSTLNFPAGDTRANAVTVGLGSGDLSFTFVAPHPGPTAQVIFDVTGYFA